MPRCAATVGILRARKGRACLARACRIAGGTSLTSLTCAASAAAVARSFDAPSILTVAVIVKAVAIRGVAMACVGLAVAVVLVQLTQLVEPCW